MTWLHQVYVLIRTEDCSQMISHASLGGPFTRVFTTPNGFAIFTHKPPYLLDLIRPRMHLSVRSLQ